MEEIKLASDAFGLDFTFACEGGGQGRVRFRPQTTHRVVYRAVPAEQIRVRQIPAPETFSIRAIMPPLRQPTSSLPKAFCSQWVTHRKPDLNDLYLIHQQGWEGAAQHVSQPDRIAWKSMCATSEGREKGEKWCKRAIWRNTLPAVKHAWKSVDKLTSGAFVGMWRERVAHFYSKYMATAAAERANQ